MQQGFRAAAGVFALVSAMTVSGAAFAVGSDSDGSDEPPKKTQTSSDCKTGEVFDKKQQKCVDAKKSSLGPDILYDAARELAYFGRPDDALVLIALLPDQADADVLNIKGYATRKAGRIEEGLGYYRAALAVDPDHVLTRSYMGQALAELGDMDGAREQLREIRRRAGPVNYAYVALANVLDGGTARY